MGLFSKPTPAAQPATTIEAPSTGTVSLAKNQGVRLDKKETPIVASNGWTASGKDYDLKACVFYRDGHVVYVGAANADESLSTPDGAIRHGGDVRVPGEREKITISWHPDIAKVALSSYSALENGTGSFKQYGVFVELDNDGQKVRISAEDASAKSTSYTLCFAELVFDSSGFISATV